MKRIKAKTIIKGLIAILLIAVAILAYLCWPKSTSVRKPAGKDSGLLASERPKSGELVRCTVQSRASTGR